MTADKEARQYPRVSKLCFTAVKQYDTSGELEGAQLGKTLNLSEGGILLETDTPLPFLAQIEVLLGLESEMLKIKGEVAHLRRREEGLVEMGIRFVEISDHDLELLRSSLEGVGSGDDSTSNFFG